MKYNIYRRTLARVMKLIRNFELVYLNEPTYFDEPVIFVLNHSSKHDVPVALEYLKQQFRLLAGKENLDFLARILFCLNGVEYVERKNKNSKHQSKERLLNCVLNGKNILLFPEGTWNLSTNKILLPLHWGVIEIAQKSKAPIVPIVLEYTMNQCYVKMGEPIYVDESISKEDGILEVASALGNLRWDIWEHIGVYKREDVTKDQFDAYIEKRLKEYPKFNQAFEKSVILNQNKDNEINTLDHINININNAFLLKQKRFYEKETSK